MSMRSSDPKLSVAVDIGGTFTDVTLQDPATGRAWRAKTPSIPADPSQAFINGVRLALEAAGAEAPSIGRVLHGTTVATNLILEGKGARAALVTRGLAELSRLTVALGGKAETAAGLSGLGDLLLTTTGPGSRNTSLGTALARGEPLDAVMATRVGVAEGVATAPAIVARAAAAGVEMPICAAVADLLAGRLTLGEAIERLLARPRRDE